MDNQYGEEQRGTREVHLSEYLMVLSKRKGMIALVFILTVTCIMAMTLWDDPVYQSSANLILDKERSSSPITGERVDYESFHSQKMAFQTSMRLIKSTPVIKQVIKELKLDVEDRQRDLEVSFIKGYLMKVLSNIRLVFGSKNSQNLSYEERQNQKMHNLVGLLNKKIDVKQVRDTRLLNISVKDKDPERAARIVNMLAKKYIEFDLASRMNSSRQTLEWLKNELYELRKKLEDDERTFFEYKQQYKVFSITGKQKLAEQKIQEFNNRYLETRNERLELDARIHELNQNIKNARGVENVRFLVSNPMIENIYSKIVDLEIELTKLSKTFKERHPKIVMVRSEIEKSKKRLGLEIQKERNNLKSKRKVLFAKERNLEKNIMEFEADALDTSGKELKYSILQRNVNTSQNLYDLMVARMKESNILQTSNVSNVRLVEKARVASFPVSPDKFSNFLISIVLGLFGGVSLSFFLEYFDRTVRTEEDIQKHFGLPVLSVIPKADGSGTYGAES